MAIYFDEDRPYGLPKDKFLEFREAFDYFDEFYCSVLPVEKLEHHLKEMGYDPTEQELKKFQTDVDPEETGGYGFDSFMKMVAYILRTGDAIEDDLIKVFRMFDVDESGLVSTEEIAGTLKELDPKISKRELKEIIEEADGDGSGKIDFEEFKTMMTKHD